MDRLKNNEFIPVQTFETFLSRKQGGKKMHFVNKPTSEHAKELMVEYMQQISDNENSKQEGKNARQAAELEAMAIN